MTGMITEFSLQNLHTIANVKQSFPDYFGHIDKMLYSKLNNWIFRLQDTTKDTTNTTKDH